MTHCSGKEKDMAKYKYFEAYFHNVDEKAADELSICGRGVRVPTVEEANAFYKTDVKGYAEGCEITEVIECSIDDAYRFYDTSGIDNWPVFGQNAADCERS